MIKAIETVTVVNHTLDGDDDIFRCTGGVRIFLLRTHFVSDGTARIPHRIRYLPACAQAIKRQFVDERISHARSPGPIFRRNIPAEVCS